MSFAIESNIKPKEGIWKISKFFSEKTAHGIYPNVYVPVIIYRDLNTDNPDPKNLSIVKHEQKHVERQKEDGLVFWAAHYLLSSKFRLNEELLAIQAEMESLKRSGAKPDIEKKAKALSSWVYLKCISYSQAKNILTEMWQALI